MTKKTNEERCRTILANLFREDGRELSEDLIQQTMKDLWFVSHKNVDPSEDVPVDILAKQAITTLSRIVKINCENATAEREGIAAALAARKSIASRRWDAPKEHPKAPRRSRAKKVASKPQAKK